MKPVTLSRPFTQSIGLTLARILQVTVICLAIGLFIVSIPINYQQRSLLCQIEPCPPGQFTLASAQALSNLGMSVDSLVTLTLALDILVAFTYTLGAVVIFFRKPDELLTIFVTIMLVTFGTATFTGGTAGISLTYPQIEWLTITLAMIGNVAILAFLFVFPNGHFTPRWTAAILVAWLLFHIPPQYFPDSPLDLRHYPGLYSLLFTLGVASGLVAQIYRYIRVSNAIERQQTKWVVYGVTVGVGGYMVIRLLTGSLADPLASDLPVTISLGITGNLLILLLPISIVVAVLRYRLWDINPIINRTLVYGLLSAGTMLFYIFVVGFLSNYFQHSTANFIISFLATGMIAVLFEPLRRRLQRAVNRLMYGDRDDPATVLAQLSQRFESVLAPDSALQTIVETLAQTLRLPYAAISIFSPEEEEPRLISRFGLAPSEVIHLPLTYQTERLGELILAPRAAGESFSAADMNLLAIIAGQAGIAVHNLRLTNDLQRSREKLVSAQEEERRRLLRDLHDGVGPTLASFSQRLDAAADLVNNDPQASVELLKELKGQVKGTVAEIRRLVYALRPPVLDEFGLVSAIREHVAQYMGPNGLSISFEVTEPMPPLPAAVEVAAYRILLEAFTNVVRHAEATRCHIKLILDDDSLLLEVSDDGKGLSTKARSGIGTASMRERAAELGGEYTLENISSGGTRVRARLPVAKE